jgi:hypothetical protein
MGWARVPMTVPRKTSWRVTANDGDPRFAADDRYATTWTSAPSKSPWIEIDLGAQASLGGLEVYWGQQTPTVYRFEGSADRKVWSGLCRTRHGEGGQDVFAFPPVAMSTAGSPGFMKSPSPFASQVWDRRCLGVLNQVVQIPK